MIGQKLVRFYTLGSMYDNGCIGAEDDEGNQYRISVGELLKIINDVEFQALKKKVHTYLTIEDNATIEDPEAFLSQKKGG